MTLRIDVILIDIGWSPKQLFLKLTGSNRSLFNFNFENRQIQYREKYKIIAEHEEDTEVWNLPKSADRKLCNRSREIVRLVELFLKTGEHDLFENIERTVIVLVQIFDSFEENNQ